MYAFHLEDAERCNGLGREMCIVQAGTEQLTVLGRHLAALPLPPRIGKMLLYGVLFGCLDPVLTVTCAMAYRCAQPANLIAESSWCASCSCAGCLLRMLCCLSCCGELRVLATEAGTGQQGLQQSLNARACI